MTQTTDVLVSELRKRAKDNPPQRENDAEFFNEAADTIDRLTRELGETKQAWQTEVAEAYRQREIYAEQAAELAQVATDHGIRMEQAEAERDTWDAAAKVLHAEAIAERDKARAELAALYKLSPISEYHEDMGQVLCHHVPIEEAPQIWSPGIDSDWGEWEEEYFTHFSPLPNCNNLKTEA